MKMTVVTDRQREELLSIMAKNSELARGFCHPYDRTKVWTMWKKFSKKLNSHGAGCKKTPQKWRHYWADLKSKSRRKRANDEPLSDFDLRLLDLAGEADGKRKPKRVYRVGASKPAAPSSPRREEVEAVSTDAEVPRLESPAQQEVSSSSQPATASTNTELIQLMARIEEKQEEAEVRAGASSSRLLAVMRRQLAVQEQQIACLQQIVDKLLARKHEDD